MHTNTRRFISKHGLIIGYKCNQDCCLDYTNFEGGEEIIIADHGKDNDWKGIEWYDSFPNIFEPIYPPNSSPAPNTDNREEGKHTKGEARIVSQNQGFPWEVIVRIDSKLLCKVEGDTVANADANAEGVVKAWNCHDEMLEIFKNLPGLLEEAATALEAFSNRNGNTNALTPKLNYKASKIRELQSKATGNQ